MCEGPDGVNDAHELWMPIPDAPFYEVSDLGRVRSRPHLYRTQPGTPAMTKERLLTPTLMHGYPRVKLKTVDLATDTLKPRIRPVHQLVLLAFVGLRPAGCIDIRHLDGVKTNNRLSNLTYGTRQENTADRVRHARERGELRDKNHCKRGHPFDVANTVWESSGKRKCRTCKNARQRRDPSKITPNSPLRPEDVKNIRAEIDAAGATTAQLAERYKVHPTTIGNIVRRRRWAHVE